MKNADYMAMIEHTGRGHEALGFVLGFLLDRKPGSALEAVEVLNQLQQSLPDMQEGLVSLENVSHMAGCIKLGLDFAARR